MTYPNPQPPSSDPFAVGTRVEVDLGGTVLECRVREYREGRLRLAAPSGARRPVPFRPGAAVKLTIYWAGACLETEAQTEEWVWMQPPVLVVGSLQRWREKKRRRARRAPREVEARLTVARGGAVNGEVVLQGWTRDLSAGGASLRMSAGAGVREGDLGWLALRSVGEDWGAEVPVRLARVRQWLRSAAHTVEIGVELLTLSERQAETWSECLSRLGTGA